MSLNLDPSQYQAAVFDAFASSAAKYRHGVCGDNILGFASEIIKRDLATGRNNAILQMFPAGDDYSDGADLVPKHAIKRYTYGLTPRWGHHVFFLAEGRVYDYDYAGQQGETFEQYMQTMWGNSANPCPVRVHHAGNPCSSLAIGETSVGELNDRLKKMGLPHAISNRFHLGEWDRLSLLHRDELMALSMSHYLSTLIDPDAHSQDFV